MRRDLHEHAELSTEEHRTQAVITERLRAIGVDDVRAIADTGVTAIVRGARPGPNILWRADIDGLPLAGSNRPALRLDERRHARVRPRRAYGDRALALPRVVHDARGQLAGTVRFAFQPAEERIGGAKRMIDQGVMDDPKVDQVFGLHLWASTPLGHVLISPGPIFAAATHIRIIIRGRGGHAAAPHQTIDPIVVASHVVIALQTIVSRAVDPADTAVVTIGRIEGGVRGNIIPNEVMLTGTIRTFEPNVLERILRRMDEIVAGVTQAWRAEYQFDHSTLPAVVNDAEAADACSNALRPTWLARIESARRAPRAPTTCRTSSSGRRAHTSCWARRRATPSMCTRTTIRGSTSTRARYRSGRNSRFGSSKRPRPRGWLSAAQQNAPGYAGASASSMKTV